MWTVSQLWVDVDLHEGSRPEAQKVNTISLKRPLPYVSIHICSSSMRCNCAKLSFSVAHSRLDAWKLDVGARNLLNWSWHVSIAILNDDDSQLMYGRHIKQNFLIHLVHLYPREIFLVPTRDEMETKHWKFRHFTTFLDIDPHEKSRPKTQEVITNS